MDTEINIIEEHMFDKYYWRNKYRISEPQNTRNWESNKPILGHKYI